MSGPEEQSLTNSELAEYTALRTTIRERGTARIYVFVGGIVGWGGLAAATAALTASPVGTLLPLVVLAAVFEAVYALHIGVERVGRYLQVFYETRAEERAATAGQPVRPWWEHAAMSFGRPAGAATADPLFTGVFALAAGLNLIPALILGPTQAELIFVGGAHALLVVRLVACRLIARKQRAIDLARFQALRDRPQA